jgi:uncharacterized RDD family membrane protein YckC
MTQSGTPAGDETALEQEDIWEAAPDADTPPNQGDSRFGVDRSTGGLTDSLTSTARMPGPAGLYYADVPNRIMALIIDIIVLSVVGFILAWLFGGLVSEPGALDSAGGELDIGAFLVVLILQMVISFAYFGGLWTVVGATAGMKILGLRIGDEVAGGSVEWRRSLIRWLLLGIPALLASLAVYVPNTIGVILTILGVLWMLLLLYTIAQSPTKQGLHDRYAHTILIKVRRAAV